MAEGLARSLAPKGITILSAGSMPAQVSAYAIEVMSEIRIDLSAHHSKSVDDIPKENVATVITLCAEEVCPVFPGEVEKLHWPYPDPAGVVGSKEEILESFRRVRDQIRAKLVAFFDRGPRGRARHARSSDSAPEAPRKRGCRWRPHSRPASTTRGSSITQDVFAPRLRIPREQHITGSAHFGSTPILKWPRRRNRPSLSSPITGRRN
jgi:arsenate reductase